MFPDRIKGAFLIALFASLAVSAPALAQTSQGARIPDQNGLAILIRTTLSALNDANRTGNYTVFRDLGSPSFRNANSSARLAEIFSSLRRKNLNLAPIVIVQPRLAKPASIDGRGLLHVQGVFPTRPLNVKFEMLYQRVENDWRLFGVHVDTPTAAAAAGQAQPKAQSR